MFNSNLKDMGNSGTEAESVHLAEAEYLPHSNGQSCDKPAIFFSYKLEEKPATILLLSSHNHNLKDLLAILTNRTKAVTWLKKKCYFVFLAAFLKLLKTKIQEWNRSALL